MKIVFAGNFLDHHILPLMMEFRNQGHEITYIASERVPRERLALGYDDLNNRCNFVVRMYEKNGYDNCISKCRDCDIFILGSAPIGLLKYVNRERSTVFFFSERIFRGKSFSLKNILRFFKYLLRRKVYKKGYLLCASAYTYKDFRRINAFKKTAYKWGYFPEVRYFDWIKLQRMIDAKEKGSIMWAGRMIELKHPEVPIQLAASLKKYGIPFIVNMVGDGPLKATMEELVHKLHLDKEVIFMGSMPAEEVRNKMEKSELFIFSSDSKEGWGVVLNEAMNAGCVVIGNDEIGSVPYLLSHEVNGLVYHSTFSEKEIEMVYKALTNEKHRTALAKNAYLTIAEKWNSKIAAERLVELKKNIDTHKTFVYSEGICSPEG